MSDKDYSAHAPHQLTAIPRHNRHCHMPRTGADKLTETAPASPGPTAGTSATPTVLERIIEMINGSGGPKLFAEIDGVIHFFFDETNLFDHTEKELGYILFDQDEINVIRPTVTLLDKLVEDIGDKSQTEYLTHQLWPELVRDAREALLQLKKKGVPAHQSFPP